MKTRGLLFLCIASLLLSCMPKKPEIPMAEAPAGPVLAALELRERSFSGLKALAGVEIQKYGRRRAFDSVGIIIDRQRRFRMEAYGPLGQSLAAVVWDGRDVQYRMPERAGIERQGPEGLARLLGEGLEPAEFCAILAGNIPAASLAGPSRLRCAESGDCILELKSRDIVRTIGLYRAFSGEGGLRIRFYELMRAGERVLRAQFDDYAEIARYPMPLSIMIENPGKNIRISVKYNDVDVNVPLKEELFNLDNEQASSPAN